MKKIAIIFGFFLVIGAIIYGVQGKPEIQDNIARPIVDISLPENLSIVAQKGKSSFDENCKICHGNNAAGQEGLGPPLIHKIYEPSHHSNESFYRAVAMGVRAHHWRFGNMAPIESIKKEEVTEIIAYIREIQRENGIF